MDADQRAVADALRERAERMLADATDRYGDAPRRDPLAYSRHHDPDVFPRSVDEQVDRIGGIGGAVVRDDDRVLCVDVAYNERDWQTPGGAVEPGDSLAETARKEVREETGVDVELTGVLYTRLVHYDYDDPEPATLPMAVFTGRKAGGRARVPDRTIPDGREEIADVRWFQPDDLPASTLDYEWIRAHCDGRSRPA